MSRSKTSSRTTRGWLWLVTQSEMLLLAETARSVQRLTPVEPPAGSRRKMSGLKAWGMWVSRGAH